MTYYTCTQSNIEKTEMISFTNSFCNLRPHEYPFFLESIKASWEISRRKVWMISSQNNSLEMKRQFLDPFTGGFFQPSGKVYAKQLFNIPNLAAVLWFWLMVLPVDQRLGPTNPTLIHIEVDGDKKTVRNRMWISFQRHTLTWTPQNWLFLDACILFQLGIFRFHGCVGVLFGFAIPFLLLILWWFRLIRRSTCYMMLNMKNYIWTMKTSSFVSRILVFIGFQCDTPSSTGHFRSVSAYTP